MNTNDTTTTATAASPGRLEYDVVPVDAITVGPNVRIVRDDDPDIEDLAASIRAVGLLNPLTVTPNDTGYTLTAGARRLAAARRVGLASVPVVVALDVDDGWAEHAQLAENLQRRALAPMEEAEAIRALLASRTVDDVAQRLGFPVVYVAKTAQLTQLVPKLRAAFAAGDLTRSAAEALSRLPVTAQDEFATRQLEWAGEWTARDVDHWSRAHTRLLGRVPWSLESVTVEGLPACASCPSNTATRGALFAELGDEARCLDGSCFTRKRDGFVGAAVATAPEGVVVLTLHHYATDANRSVAGGRPLLTMADVETTKAGGPKRGPVSAVVVDGPDMARLGDVVKVAPRRPVVVGDARTAGGASQAQGTLKAERAKARLTKRANAAAATAVIEACVAATTERSPLALLVAPALMSSLNAHGWRRVVERAAAMSHTEAPEPGRIHGWPSPAEVDAVLEPLSERDRARLVVFALTREAVDRGDVTAGLERLAGVLGVDHRAVGKAARSVTSSPGAGPGTRKRAVGVKAGSGRSRTSKGRGGRSKGRGGRS